MVDEAFPSSRSFEEVVDLALDDLDHVGVSTSVAKVDTPGVVPRLKAAV